MKDINGQDIKRDKPTWTKTGFVFTSEKGKIWQIRFPDETKRYGGASSERVAIFFLLLGMGHDLDYAKEVAFHKTKLCGKHRE